MKKQVQLAKVLSEVETIKDLNKLKLSLSDYQMACEVMHGLYADGKSNTIAKAVADLFAKYSFKVVSNNVAYTISR